MQTRLLPRTLARTQKQRLGDVTLFSNQVRGVFVLRQKKSALPDRRF